MSIIIIGGNECMCGRYQQIGQKYKCKVKVFPLKTALLGERMGTPDLLVLCMNTVSHCMVQCALKEANKRSVPVVKMATASSSAFHSALKQFVECGA